MADLIMEWATALLRWTHVIAGIAWIGSSFYFIAADLSLRHRDGLEPGVRGETWQVHGGGFYRIQKYLVAPAQMPPELTWFKWESYATWIFGFLLLVTLYYANPRLYLIDPSVLDLQPWQAVAIGLSSLAAGWVLYDRLCKSRLGENVTVLAGVGLVLLMAASALYLGVFGGRAAYLHVGALVGSLMTGNVFFIIIPNQKIVVADLMAGRQPDPRLGAQAKQRSLHNNYLTLPVVFLMLSNHYPFTFSGPTAGVVLAGIFLIGFLVRHFFNRRHAGQRPSWWLWPAAAAVVVTLTAVTTPGLLQPAAPAGRTASIADVQAIIAQRCHVCHALSPQFPGITEAPKGVIFETAADIVSHAQQIREQVVILRAMPLNNLTQLREDERATIAAWLKAGAPGS